MTYLVELSPSQNFFEETYQPSSSNVERRSHSHRCIGVPNVLWWYRWSTACSVDEDEGRGSVGWVAWQGRSNGDGKSGRQEEQGKVLPARVERAGKGQARQGERESGGWRKIWQGCKIIASRLKNQNVSGLRTHYDAWGIAKFRRVAKQGAENKPMEVGEWEKAWQRATAESVDPGNW